MTNQGQRQSLITTVTFVNDIILMSQKSTQKRINLLGEKYRRFSQENRQFKRQKVWKILEKAMEKASFVWQKLMPLSVRGWVSEFQQFNHLWQNELHKGCNVEIINELGIEKTFRHKNKKAVLGLLYTEQSFKKVMSFLNSLPLQKTYRELTFCPINIKSQYFQDTFEEKVGYFDQSLILIWKGLFNEIIVLGRLRMGELGIWKQIERIMQDRTNFQEKVKERAFSESFSSVQINN